MPWAMSAIRGTSIRGLTAGCSRYRRGRFGDVDREVADALEIAVYLDAGHHHPQIRRHRLMQREQLEAPLVDFDVQSVDRIVAGQHLLGPRVIAVDQRLHRGAHLLLGGAGHHQQPLLEVVEIILEVRHRPLDDSWATPADR